MENSIQRQRYSGIKLSPLKNPSNLHPFEVPNNDEDDDPPPYASTRKPSTKNCS